MNGRLLPPLSLRAWKRYISESRLTPFWEEIDFSGSRWLCNYIPTLRKQFVYPYHRLTKMILSNLFRKKQSFDIEREYRWNFRPGLGDIDVIQRWTMVDIMSFAILQDTILPSRLDYSNTFEKRSMPLLLAVQLCDTENALHRFEKRQFVPKSLVLTKNSTTFNKPLSKEEKSNRLR